LELIRQHRPRFNVLGQPGRLRYCYIALGHGPAVHAYVTRETRLKDARLFGPFASARGARVAVRCFNDWYRLRDCPQSQTMHFADELTLFETDPIPGCIRYDIGTCTGPCAAKCSLQEYRLQLEAAMAFLNGTDRTPIKILETQMHQASEELKFERAAVLRDRLKGMQWMFNKLGWLRKARAENTYVYPVTGPLGATRWYMVKLGRIEAVCAAPIDGPTAAIAHEELQRVYGPKPAPRSGRLAAVPAQLDHILLVAAWFRKYPDESASQLTPSQAHALIRLVVPSVRTSPTSIGDCSNLAR
jgi:excinuclease ABC subunit C